MAADCRRCGHAPERHDNGGLCHDCLCRGFVASPEPEGVVVRLCRACGAVVEDMGGTTGWVDVVSGDYGGTYDICPMNPDLDGPHDPDPTSERIL